MLRREAPRALRPPRVRLVGRPVVTNLKRGREVPGGESEYGEVKGVALNLTHSPENLTVWESADPLMPGAGQAVSAISTSVKPTPRGLRQHRVIQRQASNQASDEQGALGESPAMEVPEYRNPM